MFLSTLLEYLSYEYCQFLAIWTLLSEFDIRILFFKKQVVSVKALCIKCVPIVQHILYNDVKVCVQTDEMCCVSVFSWLWRHFQILACEKEYQYLLLSQGFSRHLFQIVLWETLVSVHVHHGVVTFAQMLRSPHLVSWINFGKRRYFYCNFYDVMISFCNWLLSWYLCTCKWLYCFVLCSMFSL